MFKAVYIDKRELKCACVGGSSNVPLGFVSLTENLMMIAMALWMALRGGLWPGHANAGARLLLLAAMLLLPLGMSPAAAKVAPRVGGDDADAALPRSGGPWRQGRVRRMHHGLLGRAARDRSAAAAADDHVRARRRSRARAI